jgi:hypothetical protein
MFNGLLWQWITSMLILLPEKSTDTFKVTFVANRELSALIAPGWLATDSFQCLV